MNKSQRDSLFCIDCIMNDGSCEMTRRLPVYIIDYHIGLIIILRGTVEITYNLNHLAQTMLIINRNPMITLSLSLHGGSSTSESTKLSTTSYYNN